MKERTPLRAIRAACMECCNGQKKEVAKCEREDCPLWPMRFGKNPNRAGVGTHSNLGQQRRGSGTLPDTLPAEIGRKKPTQRPTFVQGTDPGRVAVT
jgi:hypothetical protein